MPNARSARGLTPARASYYYELEARLRGLDSKNLKAEQIWKPEKGLFGKEELQPIAVDGSEIRLNLPVEGQVVYPIIYKEGLQEYVRARV